jgi:hypothetical protein
VNIIQTYPLLSPPNGRPSVALMVDDIDAAVETLTTQGFTMISEEDLRQDV